MGEIVFILIFTVPAVFGLAELIHLFKCYIIRPKKFAAKYLLLFLGDNEPYEQLISALEELIWSGKRYAQNIIAVNCGIAEKDYVSCKGFCEKNNLIFCETEKLSDYLDVLQGKI